MKKRKAAGGNAGAIIGSLKSPQAVPWALLVLVTYFAFKLRIEWGQCNQFRRQVRESRLDYYSAFAVAGAACVLYFGQAISHMQFANAIQGSSRLSSVMAGAVVPFGVGGCVYFSREWYKKRHKELMFFAVFFLVTFCFIAPAGLRQEGILRWPFVFLGFGIGSIGTVVLFVMPFRIAARRFH